MNVDGFSHGVVKGNVMAPGHVGRFIPLMFHSVQIPLPRTFYDVCVFA